MSRARHHYRLRLHLLVSGKFFLIPRFPLHYNSFATVAVNYNSLDTTAVNYNSFVPRTCLLLGRVTGLSLWPGWTGWVQPSPYGLGQTQAPPKDKNRNNYDRARPICFGLRMYLTKHTFMPIPFILIFGQTSPFMISENCLKKSWTFLNLFAGPSYFFFFDISLYNWSVNFYCEIQISVWYFFFKKIWMHWF